MRASILSGLASLLLLVACGPASPPAEDTSGTGPEMEAAAGAGPAADEETGVPGVMDLLAADPELSIFLSALRVGDLSGVLSGAGPFTILAPHDEAFADLPAGWVEELLQPGNEARALRIIGYHVLPGKVMAADVPPAEAGLATETLAGLDLSVRSEADGSVHVNGGRVIRPDHVAGNGVVHVIDTVLLPGNGE